MKEQYEFKKNIEEMTPEQVARQQEIIKSAELPGIETIAFLYGEGGTVTYKTGELTALCPMTGLPDFYTLRIIYTPGPFVPELKSLKIYLLGYRNMPLLHEHLACRIFDDFFSAVKPKTLKIELTANVRGGITSTVVKEK